MDSFKTYVTCIMAFFIPLTCVILYQFYSITSSELFTTNNYGIKEKKILYIMYVSTTRIDKVLEF